MSILIRGMTMPKNCLECDIRGYDANAGEEYCPITNIAALNIGRQKDWPLVELPSEHGRLIDADAFAERIETIIERKGYDVLSLSNFTTVKDVLEAVICDLKGTTIYGYMNTPTVIEAEGEE